MITVECRHGEQWDGPHYMRPAGRDRTVAVFRSQHTEMPGAAREAAQRDRWVLLREGVAGAARRTRRGRWVLACPLCRRNLPVEERELFRLLDAHHFAGMELEPGAPFRPGRRTWDTTVDLAAILRARG